MVHNNHGLQHIRKLVVILEAKLCLKTNISSTARYTSIMVYNSAKQFFLLIICTCPWYSNQQQVQQAQTRCKKPGRPKRSTHTQTVQSDGPGLTGSSSRLSLIGCRRPGLDGEQPAAGMEKPAMPDCRRSRSRWAAAAGPAVSA
jgi:hypothetical protein